MFLSKEKPLLKKVVVFLFFAYYEFTKYRKCFWYTGVTLILDVGWGEAMYVYIDVIVLINLFVNTLLLLLTAWLLGLSYKKTRLAAAVLITVVYVVIFIAYPANLCSHPFAKFLVSAVVLFVAFGKKTWRDFILLLGTFYIISFVLGGAVLGYYFFCQQIVSVHDFNFINLDLPLLMQGLLIGALLFYGLAKFIFRRQANENFITDVRLTNNRRQIIIRGFWDSGNQLYDITGAKPVILIEEEILRPLFSDAVNQFMAETDEKEWFSRWPSCQDERWKKSMAMISYRSIGGSNLLIGQHIEQVELKKDNQWCNIDCVIGIYPDKLSGDSAYQALLHSDMCLRKH